MKTINPHSRSLLNPNTQKNIEKTIARHIIVNIFKTSEKENILDLHEYKNHFISFDTLATGSRVTQ